MWVNKLIDWLCESRGLISNSIVQEADPAI